jgi:electron transfer flavoprotein alpha subunit
MNGVLAILEYRGGWNRMSWEALAAGQELARQIGEPLWAAVAGAELDRVSADLERRPATRAYLVRHELLGEYTADGYVAAFDQLIRKVNPRFVVLPHTYQVRDWAPRLATRFGQTLIADVVAIRFESGRAVFVRQLLQGRLNADYGHAGAGPGFVSVQAGAFPPDGVAVTAAETPEEFVPQLTPLQIRSRPEERFREAAQTVDLAAASVIVSVGRGIKEQINLPIVEDLAHALGAELAASRPICDNGWLPMERQVGSSGQTVSPKVYIAVGISGAIQHLVGMKGSKTVIAINKDENAPIFEVADYGVVGDLFEVVPALTLAVRNARGAE